MNIALLVTVLLTVIAARFAQADERPRVLILSDISSLEPGVREPDDGQSLIRLMLYANDLEIEGLIASSNLGHGQTVRPELIHRVIDGYREAHPSLRQHDLRYPDPAQLRSRVKAGQPNADRTMRIEESIGEAKDTEASTWIISVVDRPDPRPVWVCIWGGSADLAQALWRVRSTREPAAVAGFVRKLRVRMVNEQDSTAPWIKSTFPELWIVTHAFSVRGMYRAGALEWCTPGWLERFVKPYGPLGQIYPIYDGGDIWRTTLGPVKGIKEGDTPSFLALIPNGLNVPEQPTWGSWGGRSTAESPRRFIDGRDEHGEPQKDPDPRMSTVYRWRADFQRDFAARITWCTMNKAEANHPPVAVLQGTDGQAPVLEWARAGDEVHLDASGSSDPDREPVSFRWWQYHEPGIGGHTVTLDHPAGMKASFRIPGEGAPGDTIHVILEVRDKRDLVSYRRFVVTVRE